MSSQAVNDEIENELQETMEGKKTNKDKKSRGIRKKGPGKTRPPARPHKRMSDEQLKYNLEQLRDRIDMAESRVKAYTVRRNALEREAKYREEVDAS